MSDVLTTDLDTRARYSQGGGIFRIVPAAVARPVTAAALDEVLRFAHASDLAITCRGAGSAMDGSSVGEGLILDMSAYRPDAVVVDAAARRATVSPSTGLAALNRLASPHRLRLPVDPSSRDWATLGGMVSTNAAGARSVQVGSTRRWIDAVTLLTTDGPLRVERGVPPDAAHPVVRRWRAQVEPLLARHAAAIRARFPAVRKNSAGYALDRYLDSGDLVDIVIGSEGTLGVITEIVVRLAPVPLHRVSMRVAVKARSDLFATIEELRATDPATLEFLDASFLRLIASGMTGSDGHAWSGDAAGLLLVDIEGDDRHEIESRAARVADRIRPRVLEVRVATEAAEIAALWQVRHRASPVLAGLTDGRQSLQVIEDGCVPVDRLADYLDAVDRAVAAQQMDAVMFGHAGDGHVHVNLLPNLRDADWLDRVRTVFSVISDTVIALGGTLSGEHGAGRLRAGLMPQLYGDEVVECFREIQRAFDPAHRWNPGVIVSDGRDPLSRLKVGDGAASLPNGVDAWLRQIEVGATWQRSRWV